MQTVSSNRHILRLVQDLLDKRELPALTTGQAGVVSEAIDRWYGVPLALPTATELETYRTT